MAPVTRIGRGWSMGLGPIFVLAVFSSPSFADTVYLRSGEVIRTTVDRFSDGAFWVRDGSRTVVLYSDEVLKIVFDPSFGESRARPARPAGSRDHTDTSKLSPNKSPAKSKPDLLESFGGTVLPADANAAGSDPDTAVSSGLSILNYTAQFTSGIFQIVGEVENRMDVEARYVKVSVLLLDDSGQILNRNFSYVLGKTPNLGPGERKSFRVSFLNPPTRVSKYKIRVESSSF